MVNPARPTVHTSFKNGLIKRKKFEEKRETSTLSEQAVQTFIVN